MAIRDAAGITAQNSVRVFSDHGSPSAGDTQRYNGSAWVANDTIYNNGTNVGIGTTSPLGKLDVAGTLYFSTNGTYGTPTVNLPNPQQYIQLGDRGVVQGWPGEGLQGTYLNHNAVHQGGVSWKNTVDAALSMIQAGTGNIVFYTRSSPGAAGTAFNPVASERMRIDVNGNVTVAGKNLNNVTIDRADYIIHQDAGGYKAVRMSDGAIMRSHPSDAAVVINGLLQDLSPLYGNDSNAGVRVVIKGHPTLYSTYQTIVIPPNQDFIFESDNAVISANFDNNDIIRVDSSMNSRFVFPIIDSHGANNTAVRVKPQNPGPDGLTYFTACELYINALIGGGNGLVIDPSSALVDLSKFEILELALGHDGSGGYRRGIDILGGNPVVNNEFHIVGDRRLPENGLVTVRIASTNAAGNRFTGHMKYIDGTGVQNSFDAKAVINGLTLNTGNTNSIITAPLVTGIVDNAAGSTNRIMTSTGDIYR